MKFWNRMAGFSLAIVVVGAAGLASAQEQAAGVVRISDQTAVGERMKLQSHEIHRNLGVDDCDTHASECDPQTVHCDDGHCHGGLLNHLFDHCRFRRHYRECDEYDWGDYRECPPEANCPPEHCPYCRNGDCPYHNHNGNGWFDGLGSRSRRGVAPFGCYTIAYPVNPDHCDHRDGHLYAAQGYGINVTVPLAPNVGAAYNYGWGVPSSRLTPISNPLPMPPLPARPGPAPIVIRNR